MRHLPALLLLLMIALPQPAFAQVVDYNWKLLSLEGRLEKLEFEVQLLFCL